MLFKKLNLTIHAGESVALVGKSGSGKSTLVAMINRFYEAENPHSIRLDAIPLNDYDLTNLRQLQSVLLS